MAFTQIETGIREAVIDLFEAVKAGVARRALARVRVEEVVTGAVFVARHGFALVDVELAVGAEKAWLAGAHLEFIQE